MKVFLPRDAYARADLAIEILSVRLSVRPSVTRTLRDIMKELFMADKTVFNTSTFKKFMFCNSSRFSDTNSRLEHRVTHPPSQLRLQGSFARCASAARTIAKKVITNRESTTVFGKARPYQTVHNEARTLS